MATTQQIVAILCKAGKKADRYEKGKHVQTGYSVAKWNKGLVGVLVNSSNVEEIEEYKQIISSEGFKVWRPSGAAIDGFFVQ